MERIIKCDARCKWLVLSPTYLWEEGLNGKKAICGAIPKRSNKSSWLAEYFETDDGSVLKERLEEIKCKVPDMREVDDGAEYPEWTKGKARQRYYPSAGGGGIEH